MNLQVLESQYEETAFCESWALKELKMEDTDQLKEEIIELKRKLEYYEEHYIKLIMLVGHLLHISYIPNGTMEFTLAPVVQDWLYPKQPTANIKGLKTYGP